jgi:hypothetical protein
MLLRHDVVEVLHLQEAEGGAVCLVRAFERRFLGVTAGNRARCGEPGTAERILPQPSRGLCGPGLGAQTVQDLAVLIHRPLPIAPWALPLDLRLGQLPADPPRPLAPRQRLLAWRALLDAHWVLVEGATWTPRSSRSAAT